MHGPSISGTGTRGIDLRKVLYVLMKIVVKVQYISCFVTHPVAIIIFDFPEYSEGQPMIKEILTDPSSSWTY